MGLRMRYWALFLLVVFVTAAATATLVGAEEEAQPTIAEQAGAAHEKVVNEAVPTITEKIEHAKEVAQEQAEHAGETVKTWKDWAVKSAGEWTGKGSESAKEYYTKSAEGLHASTTDAQKSASGIFNKWSTWAKDTAGKYRPKKNPAADAVEYLNKHRGGDTDAEL